MLAPREFFLVFPPAPRFLGSRGWNHAPTSYFPGGVNAQPLDIVDIFITCQSAVDRLAQQRHKAMLPVLAEATILQAVSPHLGQAERLVEFPLGHEHGVGRDLTAEELQPQPTCEVNSTNGDLGWSGPAILDQDFLPCGFFFVEAIEPIDVKSLSALGVGREHVADAEAAPNPPTGAGLGDCESSQGAWIRQIRFAQLHQPGVGSETVGNDLLNHILTGLGGRRPEATPANRKELPSSTRQVVEFGFGPNEMAAGQEIRSGVRHRVGTNVIWMAVRLPIGDRLTANGKCRIEVFGNGLLIQGIIHVAQQNISIDCLHWSGCAVGLRRGDLSTVAIA
jgi:hypothetical protein